MLLSSRLALKTVSCRPSAMAAMVLTGLVAVAPVALVEVSAAAEAQSDVATLPKVKVVSEADTPEALPEAYSGNQVARGGQLGLLGNVDFMDMPFNLTAYTATLIEDQQAHSLSDVLINDASVRSNWPRGSHADNFMIRGFNVSSPNVALAGLYGIVPVDRAPVEAMERVEVLKGPSALLNGMSPGGLVGGNINIVPKRAGLQPLTRFTASYYSDAQFGGHLDVGRRFGADDSIGVRFNGIYREGDTPVERQSERMLVTTLGADYRTERSRWSLDVGYQNQDVDAPLRYIRVSPTAAVPDAPDTGSNAFPSWSYVEQNEVFGVARGEFDLSSRVTAFAAFGGREFKSGNLLADPTVINGSGQFASFVYDLPYDQDSASTQLGLRGALDTGPVHHELSMVGTRLKREFFSNFILYGQVIANLDNPVFGAAPARQDVSGQPPKSSDSVLSSVALADTLAMLDERVMLTLGLRLQQIETNSFNATTGLKTSTYDDEAVTPGVGVVYRPSQRWSLYANYIQGLSEAPTPPATAANRNDVFEPVETEQYEAGVKFDTGRFATTLSLFQIAQPNGITDVASNVFSINGEQRNRGLELNTFGEPVQGFRLMGGVALMDGELTRTQAGINDGNTAIGVPDAQLNAGVEWDAGFLPGFTLTARALHTSAQYLDQANTQRIPDWTRLDLGVRYAAKAMSTPITVRASVENVFDDAYWASTGGGYLTLGAPRTLLLSITTDL